MKRYNPKELEPKWQKKWADDRLYEADESSDKDKIYATPMLPYPSGTGLHTGHVRNYSITDTVARFHRQNGFNTLTTIAWDSFGLPAENFAIKTGTPPAESTAKNIAYFKKQLQTLGMSYDWTREFNTSDPSYYKWTQWVFGLMYSRGLAYKAEKQQWWCELCNTVLADEQVVAGKCWRHDGEDDPMVKKRPLSQWFFKLTEYADEILESTDELNWPDKIKTMQKNWIGRSEGTVVVYPLEGLGSDGAHIDVFTTAVETIFGTTFLVLAPEHPLVKEYGQRAENAPAIEEYVLKAQRKSEIDREADKVKTGIPVEGLYAINPINGDKMPVWIADYVLMGYGSGAIMAVPGEDERDNQFAHKYDLPIVYTTDRGEFTNYQTDIKPQRSSFTLANSGEFDGMDFESGRSAITKKLIALGSGEQHVQYKVRDWLISRQRYWGTPVPIVYVKDHGEVLVPESQLPVELPVVENYVPDGKNSSVLAGVEDWVHIWYNMDTGESVPFSQDKPASGDWREAHRETDVMDGYVCSTWYLHRYTDARNDVAPFDVEKANYWYPIDFYFGGDHAVAHLLYVRFFQKVLVDAGLAAEREPVKRLVYNGYIYAADGTKMSKSKGNTVDPMDIINSGYGADALRVFELFIAPYEQDTVWNENGVPGSYRFLNRVWTLVQEYQDKSALSGEDMSDALLRSTHKMIAKVTKDLEKLSFNTAVSAMMTNTNELFKIKADDGYGSAAWQSALEGLVQCLAPFAPHIAEEMWHDLGHSDSVHVDHWPEVDESYLVNATMKLAVQVNGKVRGEIEVDTTASEAGITATAQQEENVHAHIDGATIVKTIYVPNRLVNFVVK